MKKTLIALGVLAALPSLALSAEVSIYGKVDVGLAFVNVDPGVDGQDSWSNLSMQSGQTAGSRVGMTGFEELATAIKSVSSWKTALMSTMAPWGRAARFLVVRHFFT